MIKVNQDECIGCGICANLCPQGIEIVEGKARIIDEDAECLKDAASACPRGAILINNQGVEKKEVEDYRYDNVNNWMGQRRGFRNGTGRGKGLGRRKGQGRNQRRGRAR